MDQDDIFTAQYRKMIETFNPLPEESKRQLLAILEKLCLGDNCGNHQYNDDKSLAAK